MLQSCDNRDDLKESGIIVTATVIDGATTTKNKCRSFSTITAYEVELVS